MYDKRTGRAKFFSSDLLLDFKRRHSNSIEKVTTERIDDDRAQINPKEVDRYITSLDVMKHPSPPILLLSFEKTGFSKRTNKRKRKCVFVLK